MAIKIIPVRSDVKAYEFTIDLEGTIYTLSFGYNTRAEYWYMSIGNSTGETILGNLPILTGSPLTDQFVDEDLPPGRFGAFDETGQGRNAGEDNFGSEIKLYYEESA